jgi:CelD/BcsL family acetyltransferase involved in cellulose biosynthesis
MRVETVTTAEGFAALRDGWDDLACHAHPRSVFLRYDWFAAAWHWRQRDAELRIHVARNGDAIAAILPLIRLRGSGRSRRICTLLTVPDTQCCDMIADAGSAIAASEAIARHLAARRDWDVIILDYLPAHSMIVQHFPAQLQVIHVRAVMEERGRNLYIPLESNWMAYWATRSRSVKKAANLAANRLQRTGTTRVERLGPGVTSDADFERALAAAISISARSWKQATGNSLDRPGPGSFIRALSATARRHGWLSLWLIYLDDKPVAMEYQLIHAGNVHALRSDFDASLDHVSPGSFLFRHLIERLFDGGHRQYLMGPGDNAYKLRWSTEGHSLHRLTGYNRTPAGRIAHWLDRRAKPPLRALRDRLYGNKAEDRARDVKTLTGSGR